MADESDTFDALWVLTFRQHRGSDFDTLCHALPLAERNSRRK